MSSGPEPGWYFDPDGGDHDRYWNGTAWTEHRRARNSAPAPPPEGAPAEEHADFDVFISYARRDDADGWVSSLRDAIYDDFREFSSEPFRIFFDQSDITSRQDWQLRLSQGLRTSRVLLICLSPNFLRSPYCRWEWDEFARMHARRIGGGDAVTGVYFVDLGGNADYEVDVVEWRRSVEAVQLEQLIPWFPAGARALQEEQVRRRIKALGRSVYEQLRQAHLAKLAPGNLRRHNPAFVGRAALLRDLRRQLAGGPVGGITAVHGLGGMGKTEVAVTYAHTFAHDYQGGTWQVDTDGQSNLLEAVSSLALAPELGLEVRDEHLRDREWLGRRVLARLSEHAAGQGDSPVTCLLLLDNVSEPTLLSEAQLAALGAEPWLHVLATTRLGPSDLGAGPTRGAVTMIEVGPLTDDDALTLIREHQPARDARLLQPDFSSPAEAEAAARLVTLLDGYTLAVEQAAVYLGTSETEPSRLVALLETEGTLRLDQLVNPAVSAQSMLHEGRLAGTIVDQTLSRLPDRAARALTFASLLPPEAVPWEWLRRLTADDDFVATRRLLEGRRLLTQSDDDRFARLHRVVREHLRSNVVHDATRDEFDSFLETEIVPTTMEFDVATMAIVAQAVAGRLEDHGPADMRLAGLGSDVLFDVIDDVDVTLTGRLGASALATWERIAEANVEDVQIHRRLAIHLSEMGSVEASRGDADGGLEKFARAAEVFERLADEHRTAQAERDLAVTAKRTGDLLLRTGDVDGAQEQYAYALVILERLTESYPDDLDAMYELGTSLQRGGMLHREHANGQSKALDYFSQAVEVFERLVAADSAPQHRRELAVGISSRGQQRDRQGDQPAALADFVRAQQLQERLVEDAPGNARYLSDLTATLQRIGEVMMRQGDVAEGLARLERAVHMAEVSAAGDSANVDRQTSLARSHYWLADALNDAGRSEAAIASFSRALELFTALSRIARAAHRVDMARCLAQIGILRAGSGNPVGAIDDLTRATRIGDELAVTNEIDRRYRHDDVAILVSLGRTHRAIGDDAKAVECYLRALTIAELLDNGDVGIANSHATAVLTNIAAVLEADSSLTAGQWEAGYAALRGFRGYGELTRAVWNRVEVLARDRRL